MLYISIDLIVSTGINRLMIRLPDWRLVPPLSIIEFTSSAWTDVVTVQ